MCGVLGVVSRGSPSVDRFEDGLRALHHRGPESTAVKRLTTSGVVCVMGHTRLRIIDIHERADQPMTEESGTVWITYNGELYNHTELRNDLEGRGHRFVSNSDTESIVHLYEELGGDVERMLGRLRGMFAFASVRHEARPSRSGSRPSRDQAVVLVRRTGRRARLRIRGASACSRRSGLRRPESRGSGHLPRLGECAGTDDVVRWGPRSDARRVHRLDTERDPHHPVVDTPKSGDRPGRRSMRPP